MGVVAVAPQDTLVHLAVRRFLQRPQHQDDWDEELLLAKRETECGITVVQVVECDGHAGLVSPCTPHGHGLRRVLAPTLREGRPVGGHDVVAPRELQHTNNPLDSVTEEVAALQGNQHMCERRGWYRCHTERASYPPNSHASSLTRVSSSGLRLAKWHRDDRTMMGRSPQRFSNRSTSPSPTRRHTVTTSGAA